MPPFDLWLRGRDDILTWWFGPGIGCRGSRVIPTRAANGSPAFGAVQAERDRRGLRPVGAAGARAVSRPDRRVHVLPRHRDAVPAVRPAGPPRRVVAASSRRPTKATSSCSSADARRSRSCGRGAARRAGAARARRPCARWDKSRRVANDPARTRRGHRAGTAAKSPARPDDRAAARRRPGRPADDRVAENAPRCCGAPGSRLVASERLKAAIHEEGPVESAKVIGGTPTSAPARRGRAGRANRPRRGLALERVSTSRPTPAPVAGGAPRRLAVRTRRRAGRISGAR